MRKYIIALLIAIFCISTVANAEVFTTQKTEGMGNCIYVAGSPDMHPIEFYDEEKSEYSGMIPDMLRKISDKIGIDFVYINGNKTDKLKMGENLQVEIVSSVMARDDSFSDFIEIISYEEDGRIISVGVAFTEIASKELISKINQAESEISQDEKNGIALKYAEKSSKINVFWIVTAIIATLLLLAVITVLVLHIRRLKRENTVNRMTDEETGMGNLRYFYHHFKHTIGDISGTLYYIVYIIIDSGYLKSYHGEKSYEDVLGYTSAVLRDSMGDRDFVARIAESEFAMAIQSTDDEIKNRVEEILKKLDSFTDTKENNKGMFFGSVYHLSNRDKECEILLSNLKKNCNEIFGTDKQIVYCNSRSMNRIQEEKKITESILNGFEKNEFKMYLQFIVDSKTKEIISAEALSRWDNYHEGLIGPGKYIGNMESSGLISKHDFHMFDLACKQLEKWNNTEFSGISISCNFTRITLSEEDFIEKLEKISKNYTFDRKKLAIEITEDAIERNREVATKNVSRCKELGFRVYLDDLGNGYTTLANLCDYPIDVVKIDHDILLRTEVQRGKELFEGIVALAHSLQIKVICEGVDNDEHNTIVEKSECDFIQGWYYSKALPLEECETFIRNYSEKIKKTETT